MNRTETVTLRPTRVATLLGAVTASLVLFHVLTQAYKAFVGTGVLAYTVAPKFNLDAENTVPTYFASVLLLGATALLALVAHGERGSRYRRHWAALAVIFLALSVDEASSFHELLVRPLRSSLGTEGWLLYAWVIPGLVFVAVFALSYLGFLFHLSPRFRTLFAASGLLYVGGALGMEMVAGQFMSRDGAGGFAYILLSSMEEAMEMFGVVLFIYALLSYAKARGHVTQIRFDAGPAAALPATAVPGATLAYPRAHAAAPRSAPASQP